MNNHEQKLNHDLTIQDGISKLDKSMLPTPLTEVDIIIKKSQEVCQAVAYMTRELDSAVRASGHNHDIKTLVATVSSKFAEGFNEFSKDELVFLMSMIHTDMVVDALTGNTQTPSIIKPI
jgi:hypothetical protein